MEQLCTGGISEHCQNEIVDMDAGTATGSLYLSTNAANARNKQVSQESDATFELPGSEESINSQN